MSPSCPAKAGPARASTTTRITCTQRSLPDNAEGRPPHPWGPAFGRTNYGSSATASCDQLVPKS
ncbi:hypothetical protein ACFOLD_14160 [Kocuria carniphila]|uniref:hypothetical protein n=1 Tax=Kocuria carniphila TaxID=262208 RepID=UPI003614BF97